MIQYVLRRLMILPIIIFLVTLVLFFLMWQLPIEQRAQVYMPTGVKRAMTAEDEQEQAQRLLEATVRKYGLDRPFPAQYVAWLRALATGDWGFSPSWQEPVLEGLLRRVPATAELALAAMVPSVSLALLLGGFASRHQNRLPDHVVRVSAFVAWAFPSFILGLMLINVFYAWLDWFPPERLSIWAGQLVHNGEFRTYTGMYTVDALLNGDLGLFWDALRHLVLPSATLALAEWALLARIMRSSMLEALGQDYITTARGKGLSEQRVAYGHARRNALLPVISTGGVAVSMLISGLIVIESVFNFGGVGKAAAEAIFQADIPVALGFTLLTCTVTILASLIADVLYAVADPRVRLY